jgi:Skp family chaperone for outer membrane proteins
MNTNTRHFLSSLALLAAAALSMGQTTPGAAPGTAPPPSKLAVVNLVALFDSLDEQADAQRDMENMKANFTREIEKRRLEVERLERDLQDQTLIKRDSPEFRRMQDELLDKSMSLQAYSQSSQQKLFLELRLRTAYMLRKINDSIATYSQANGIALVFVSDDFNLNDVKTQQELLTRVSLRKLVYAHPAFDITRAIRERMNTEFKLGAGRPAAPAAPAPAGR